MTREIMQKEQEHLQDVRRKLQEQLEKEEIALEVQREKLKKEREIMWEECAHGIEDFDDIINLATYNAQVGQEQGHYLRRNEAVRQLNYLLKTPYFGRIDFQEEGEKRPEEIYIGRYGFCDRETYEYYIYDWRTPLASMFYEYGIGKGKYECPAGEIEGEITCKRQYRIVGGELKYYCDTNTVVQDDVLEEVLSENTDKVLRVIVDTITKEQNRAIREKHTTDLLVTGPAGSGKTSVGMHRLAYLLYHNRDQLTQEKIVVLSRNEIFSSYISGILPELGEENVQAVLFDDLIRMGIPREFKKRWYYEQMEYLMEQREYSIRRKSIVLKYSEEFLAYMEEQSKPLKGTKPDGMHCVEKYIEILREYTGQGAREVYQYTKHCITRKKLMYEDILLIGYLRILLGVIRPMENISQVVIDEAQDYNALQLTILKKLYPKSCFTILADPNQAIFPETSTVENYTYKRIFGEKLIVKSLQKSYRSTAPINRYALNIIGKDNPEAYIDRQGKEPQLILTRQPKEDMIKLLESIPENRSVGILTINAESVNKLKRLIGRPLKNTGRVIQYIVRPDEVLEEKIVALPILLAKGLEFDVIIVWDDKTEAFWEKNKNLKYLMCTRALHELYFLKELLQ